MEIVIKIPPCVLWYLYHTEVVNHIGGVGVYILIRAMVAE